MAHWTDELSAATPYPRLRTPAGLVDAADISPAPWGRAGTPPVRVREPVLSRSVGAVA